MHGKITKQYWADTYKTETDILDFVDWESVGRALKQLNKQMQHFVTKHMMGMCRVGKFMKGWKKWEHEKCHHCVAKEDAQHVWLCNTVEATEERNKGIRELEAWMYEVATSPDITQLFLHKLQDLRSGREADGEVPPKLRQAVQTKNDIGWSLVLEGWLSIEWTAV